VSLQVFPEGQPEHLVVGGSACPDGTEEAAPGIGHPTANAIQIKTELHRGVEQLPG